MCVFNIFTSKSMYFTTVVVGQVLWVKDVDALKEEKS